VKVEHRVVDSLDLKARKNLIEARIYLKLGGIFKEVGLVQKANEKANEGLDRVNDVINTSVRSSLDRSLVEEAFSVKWDLLLVQDKLADAINVCQSLMQLFPDSSLVDKALLKIGQAKMESEHPGDAIGIFNGVVRLPKSELKAEAQYDIGQVEEMLAMREAERTQSQPVLSQAMQSYKKCAESYPNSPFAGESLDKIANYYISTKDYARAVELMEQVFQDYPDASFLDKMLLKWVIASYRMGNYPVAKQKAEQLLSEYPNSKSAEKARAFLEVINKKLGGPG
jgi:TolA-binding protein